MAGDRSTFVRAGGAFAIALAALGIGYAVGHREPPPPAEAQEKLADTAVVLVAVRGLARLESVAFHMERIIDLTERQPRLFGLVEVDDAILLVAAGDVVAGIDLAAMQDGDVIAEPLARRVELRLPAPQILTASLDNERTYVHSRKTDLLAKRNEQIEGRARELAERSIREAALEQGILQRAAQSAEHTVTVLARSLGYDHVVVRFAEPAETKR
jgi:hypothetical protein